MRFIDLRKRKDDAYPDAAIKLGCGPNFVRNRRALFEQMIKEQGKEFWFRFWLTFCSHPDIKEVEEFSQGLPIRTVSLCQLLHTRFVEVSTELAISFCWSVVFEKPTPVGVSEIILSEGQFIDETYQFVVINFACALCEVFCKWLRAKEVGDAKPDYFSVPPEYFEPQFTPGLMEKHMIKHWGTKLIELLGVGRTQVPWINKCRLTKQNSEHQRQSLYTYSACLSSKTISRKLKVWLLKVKKITRAIRDIDEEQILVSCRSSKREKNPPATATFLGHKKGGYLLSLPNGIKYEIENEMMEQMEKRAAKAMNRITASKVKNMKRSANTTSKEKGDWSRNRRTKSHHSYQRFKKWKKNRSQRKIRSKSSALFDATISTENAAPPCCVTLEDSSINTESSSTTSSCHPKIPINAFAGVPAHNDSARRCDTCNAVLCVKPRKCQLCVEENWKYPRCYCNIVCQTKDWFQQHEREHNLHSQEVLRRSGVYLRNDDVVVSKAKSEISSNSGKVSKRQGTF